MKKRLIFCCDGTWNSHDDESPTNVFKLRNLIVPTAPDGTAQSIYYDAGVGTAGSIFRRAIDGATGRGLPENIRQAYRSLIDHYEDTDEIFLFGFSRGAYTVRSLAGLIRNCGILQRKYKHLVDEAYSVYCSRRKADAPGGVHAKSFRAQHAVADTTRIRFVGVWDTVGALGNPILRHSLINRRLRFHDVNLSSKVDFAYQALGIDELRKHFTPSVWKKQAHAPTQTMEQVWFIGAHSDIGGGYRDKALSKITLNWLLEKASSVGLVIDQNAAAEMKGVRFPEWMPIAHDSHKGFYNLFAPKSRVIDDAKGPGNTAKTNERLHWTVIARYKQDLGYRPANLVEYITRHPDVLEKDPPENAYLAGP